ncbi:MAG TPA: MaoC family dehydratase [Flexivirga sp.]|uniref:MaoC family dehydratase n=1 Tax=Flexivirga sp. TaxID=1962927 RepID=UPI002C7E9F3F|nr:MaoC family dehydratase [Flexivirga sp.]HWC24753.1 MaoC family dehydratase [Flexivirga sp.]
MSFSDIPRDDRRLEDYVVGNTATYGPISATGDEILDFATKFDPQPIHIDEAAAAAGPFGGVIASGWHSASLMMRLYVDHYMSHTASLGGPGIDELRWTAPVRPDDRLTLRTTVLETRPSRSKPDRGLLRTQCEVTNQDGVVVMTCTLMNIVTRRDG